MGMGESIRTLHIESANFSIQKCAYGGGGGFIFCVRDSKEGSISAVMHNKYTLKRI